MTVERMVSVPKFDKHKFDNLKDGHQIKEDVSNLIIDTVDVVRQIRDPPLTNLATYQLETQVPETS